MRSILFSATLVVAGLYVITYLLLSLPVFTDYMKNRIAMELSELTGGEVMINSLIVYPFSEVTIKGLDVIDPSGKECLSVATLGAGVNLWKFVTTGDIEISYAEIIGLNATVVQEEKDGDLNIKFLIDAFAPKDDNKEKKSFQLALKNVVLRKSSFSFYRPWMGDKKIGLLTPGNIQVQDMAADIAFPRISDHEIKVDLRRLSLTVPGMTTVKEIGLDGVFSSEKLLVNDFTLELPNSRIYIPRIAVESSDGLTMLDVLKYHENQLRITDSFMSPSDFSFLFPPLSAMTQKIPLEMELEGNLAEVDIPNFHFGSADVLDFSFRGELTSLNDISKAKAEISDFRLFVSSKAYMPIVKELVKTNASSDNESLSEILSRINSIEISGAFNGDMDAKILAGHLDCSTDKFFITAQGEGNKTSGDAYQLSGELTLENFDVKGLYPKIAIEDLNANIIAEGIINGKDSQGMVSLVVDNLIWKGERYDGFSLNLGKDGERIEGDFYINNSVGEVESNFLAFIENKEKKGNLELDIKRLTLSQITDMKDYNGYNLSGYLSLEAEGSSVDDATGELLLKDFLFASQDRTRYLNLNKLTASVYMADSARTLDLRSDWVDLRAEGDYRFRDIPVCLTRMAEKVFPSLISTEHSKVRELHDGDFVSDLEFDILVKKNNSVPEFFNLPVRLLVPLSIAGTIDGASNSASLQLNLPYLQQGKDKLIYDTRLTADIDGEEGVLNAMVKTTMPVKRGDLSIEATLFGKNNNLTTDFFWINTENPDFKGHLVLDTQFRKKDLSSMPEIRVDINPSVLKMGAAEWHMAKSDIVYHDKKIDINHLRLWHEDQFVDINGVASDNYADVVNVSLADIDVDYIFEMLAINYVTFGGVATGEVSGHALLSGDPVAETESMVIKNFTYNGAPLGTCVASSQWNNDQKEIEISADISIDGVRKVFGSGGIWLGRDSLCFDISANKVPVEFVQPFMQVFSSHVGGFATGDVRLYGNFHDIDMTGKIFADSVAVKLDYTNTIYHGSDSVLLTPGRIDIPHFRLYDKNGNSALLTGELTHRYFHDPAFNFRLSGADDFLCYDTTPEINPDWYGTLYGTGSALLKGEPGLVDISADMTVGGNSSFTFVLNETEYARDYQFLTFSNKKAVEAEKTETLTADHFKELLKKRMNENEGSLSRFSIDIRATVTPRTLFTLVMDPGAGDKITARGKGAMQVKYESDDDEMMMYGKYEIEEGNYNFSLQDIILRDFKIKEGSYISFNGNPLAADLDISATYRVNTNLSDLDKSFSTDRDLNRTNVPVDAVLSVNGNMQQPDITFDIELPTLTQDVERKVKSIISTDDMMNRQIIYLLALNRFYTPEYMGASGNGGELAAVASSTISSQLSNMLGQMTDKFSVAPSFRSDKGDFSDIEVDVALSSRLLNNRLLINGNFGYRDHTTSTTTFVGDFDVEYLLSKNGNLRLKAYNHFNDQNYYLREALTTQGLGIVYRRDFDNWFTFLKKRKDKEEKDNNSEKDTETEDGSKD